MGPDLQAAAIAVGTVVAAGLAGLALVMLAGRRSAVLAAGLAPVVVVVATGLGIGVSARAMYISQADSSAMWVLLAATLPCAVLLGLGLSRITRDLMMRASDEAAARAAQEEAFQARRTLVAGMSHDLRTPLAGIRALAESLEDGIAPDPAASLGRIRAEVDRMDAMLGDLLDLSRLQGGGALVRREPVDLHDLLSDTVATFAPIGARHGVVVHGSAGRHWRVVGDHRLISRAVANLVANAVRHTCPGGQVRVWASGAPGWVTVSVADRCGGIPEQDLPHLFEAGFRGTSSRTPPPGDDRSAAHGGAGIGLSITDEIARAHGGHVQVENVPDGCCFILTLPH